MASNKLHDAPNMEMVKRVGGQGAPKGAPMQGNSWSPPAGAPLCKYKTASMKSSKKGKGY